MNKEIKITPNGIKQALENLLNENEQLQKELTFEEISKLYREVLYNEYENILKIKLNGKG